MIKQYRHIIWLAILFVCHFSYGASRADSTVIVSADPPYKENQYLHQALFHKGFDNVPYTVRLKLDIATKDSFQNVYDVVYDHHKLKSGIHRSVLNIERNDKANYIDYAWLEAVKQYNQLPVGNYRFQLIIKELKTGMLKYSGTFEWQSDSTMPAHSGVLNKLFDGKASKLNVLNQPKRLSQDLIQKSTKYTRRRAKQIKGIQTQEVQRDGMTYTAIYYKSWFLGYVQQLDISSMQASAVNRRQLLKNNPASLMQTDLPQFSSVGSQFRNVDAKNREEETITSNIDIIGNFSTNQEPGSQQDNNFQEYRADLRATVADIPISIQGYYNSQDQHRKAKASFIRVSYDVDKQKENLRKSTSAYTSMYEYTIAKGSGTVGLAQAAIQTLTNQLLTQKQQFYASYRIKDTDLKLSDGSVDKLSTSDSNAARFYQNNKEDIQHRYQQIQHTEAQLSKTRALLEQYQHAQYFDSAMNYSRIVNTTSTNDYSYKSLAKAASNILPDTKVKTFIAGLTKLNAGMLQEQASSYTLSGQTMKGLSIGYDFDLFKFSFSGGKTEYISRAGTVDKYNSYLFKVDMKSVLKQKTSLMYYLYSPTKQILDDNNFLKTDVSVPNFQQPVHIISLAQSGQITKGLLLETEAAVSYRNNGSQPDWKHTALKTAAEYELPSTDIRLKGQWEHIGKSFENNTLPYTRAGIEHYTLSAENSFFKSMLKIGVQFDQLKQGGFNSTGYNRRWGFNIQTKSKQYPNIYISYKPFSTFRRNDDTLNISQRPVFGSVWIARTTYQFRRQSMYHRFMLTYNRNQSVMDTVDYLSGTLQLGYYLNDKKYALQAVTGWTNQPVYMAGGLKSQQDVVFFSIGGSRQLGKQLSCGIGEEIGVADFGLQRITTNINIRYRFMKLPITFYTVCRYSSIRANVQATSTEIWYGQIGVNCRLQTKQPTLTKKKRLY